MATKRAFENAKAAGVFGQAPSLPKMFRAGYKPRFQHFPASPADPVVHDSAEIARGTQDISAMFLQPRELRG
jgi:hypothetical protein